MGFITYQHHTHPNVAWFDKQEEWASAPRQLNSTVHIVFPAVINALFLYIMEHSAHHVNPIIPLYRLRGCQAALAAAVRHYVWSPKQCLDTFARCKLYDYENHQWQDFDGVPTSAPSLAGQFELGNGVLT
jgi:omega-6 fatty acid desaturase (delta-12 desaturase)